MDVCIYNIFEACIFPLFCDWPMTLHSSHSSRVVFAASGNRSNKSALAKWLLALNDLLERNKKKRNQNTIWNNRIVEDKRICQNIEKFNNNLIGDNEQEPVIHSPRSAWILRRRSHSIQYSCAVLLLLFFDCHSLFVYSAFVLSWYLYSRNMLQQTLVHLKLIDIHVDIALYTIYHKDRCDETGASDNLSKN